MSGNRSKSAFFEGGSVNLSADFRGKGASPTNHCWYQSSRVIAFSCGIKISVVRHLVLSQSTRVTDRQTDGRTDRITTPKTALAYARAVKIVTSAAAVGSNESKEKQKETKNEKKCCSFLSQSSTLHWRIQGGTGRATAPNVGRKFYFGKKQILG